MAHPIQLFNFYSEDEEEKQRCESFLLKLDAHLNSLFGTIKANNDKMREYHTWDEGEVPKYLSDIGTESVQKIVKDIKGDLKWTGSVALCGRKTGTTIKKTKDVLYRIILHFGPPEIYGLHGNGFDNEPVVLPNGWALLCSPVLIDNVDVKVNGNPIRKDLNPDQAAFVSKIRLKDYMRITVTLNLLIDGVDLSSLSFDDINPGAIDNSSEHSSEHSE